MKTLVTFVLCYSVREEHWKYDEIIFDTAP